jgi:hypothetical protein
MKKKELKELNKNLEINVVDLISKLDPTKTGKYTKFLIDRLNVFLEDLKRENDYVLKCKEADQLGSGTTNLFKTPETKVEDIFHRHLLNCLVDIFGYHNMEILYQFENHLKNNRIGLENRDINNYDSWDQLGNAVSMAEIKLKGKKLKKEVLTVLDNEDWLIIRPLTFESSTTYGSNTRWCTASKNNREYFYRYSRNGVLCYLFNKKSGDRYGIYYSTQDSEFSIWTVQDRRVDTLETNIPFDVIRDLYVYMKNERVNYHYFSKEEIRREYELIDESKIEAIEPESMVVAEITDELERNFTRAYEDQVEIPSENTTPY